MYTYILILPVIYFFYEVFIYFSSLKNASISGITESIHTLLLLEFILVVFIFYFKKFDTINNILKQNIAIFIVGLFLFGLKLFLLEISEVKLDIIYLFKILFSVFIELIPLFIIRTFLSKRAFKIIYILFLIFIILLNLGISIYYYHTSELIEPLIFSNVNLTSIKGFFLNYSLSNIAFVVIGFAMVIMVFIYIVNRYESKHSLDMNLYYKRIIFFIGALFLMGKILFYGDKFTANKVFALYGYEKLQKNIVVDKITSNSLWAYVKAYYLYLTPVDNSKDNEKVIFSAKEKERLDKLALFLDKKQNYQDVFNKYNKIIIVAFESLSIDFINHYNSKIPHEATPYLNFLLKKYFHINNYFTSNMPTDYGWTSMLKSKLDLNRQGESLFSILKKEGYKSHYIVASSRFYGLKADYYPASFKFDKWDYKESLQVEYGKQYSGWGFHNDIVFDKAIQILKECDKEDKIVISTETADFHQPGSYCGFSDDDLPSKIKDSDKLIKSIYWIDQTLKKFIQKIKEEKIFDDKTLIIITADHNPHPSFEFKQYSLKNNYKRLSRIPLIFITKHNDFQSFYDIQDNQYSQVDLLPTLLSILDVDYNASSFFGGNIFDGEKRAYLGKYRNNLFYRYNTLKFICNLENTDESQNCQVIKKYFYNIQGMK